MGLRLLRGKKKLSFITGVEVVVANDGELKVVIGCIDVPLLLRKKMGLSMAKTINDK